MSFNITGQSRSTYGAHACNCIGCCKKCGRCLTHPAHASACEVVAALNKPIADAYRGAAA